MNLLADYEVKKGDVMAIAAGISEKFVTMSHGRTRYLEAGTGEPVILIHGVGYTGGGDSWLLNIEPLATRLRVLAVDCLGWGLGDRLDTEYSFAYLVDFIREFQDVLGIEKSHIVGHSMGGWIASVFAYESPNRVDKLVLVASGGSQTRTLRSMTEFNPPSQEALRKQIESQWGASGLNLDELTERNYAKTQVPGALEAYRRILKHMNDPVNRQRYNTRRRLPHITAPTLVVWGTADETNALAMGEDTHQLIPNSELLVLEGCSHWVPTERPKELNAALLRFLGG